MEYYNKEIEIRERKKHIKRYIENIINDTNTLTTGNVSHHKISIKRHAEYIKEEFLKLEKYL